MDDLPFAFDFAEDGQQFRSEQFTTLAVGKIAPDDYVGGAGLVFKRHEYDAAFGIGTLTPNHDSGSAHDATMRRCADVGGRAKPPLPKACAQQRQRMPAQREAECPV